LSVRSSSARTSCSPTWKCRWTPCSAVDADHYARASLDPARELGVFPVADAGRHFARANAAVLEHIDALALDQRAGRDAQHVSALGQDHLDVGAVAGQQQGVADLVDLRFDLDGARLLLGVEHVGRDAPHVGLEAALAERVERDAGRHAFAHARRVHLVDRRGDVDAAGVDDVHRGRRRDADRRRRHELADLAVDLGHRACERCAQPRALEASLRRLDARQAHPDLFGGRVARRFASLRFARGTVSQLGRNELARHEGLKPVRLSPRDAGRHAGLLTASLDRRGIALGDRQFGADVVVPQLEQQLAGLDTVALLHRQARDLPAGGRGQLGALAGLDRARPGVGDCLGDAASTCLHHLDVDRLGTPEPQHRGCDGGGENRQDPEGAPFHAESPVSSAA